MLDSLGNIVASDPTGLMYTQSSTDSGITTKINVKKTYPVYDYSCSIIDNFPPLSLTISLMQIKIDCDPPAYTFTEVGIIKKTGQTFTTIYYF